LLILTINKDDIAANSCMMLMMKRWSAICWRITVHRLLPRRARLRPWNFLPRLLDFKINATSKRESTWKWDSSHIFLHHCKWMLEIDPRCKLPKLFWGRVNVIMCGAVSEVNFCLHTRRTLGSSSVLTSVRSIIPFVHHVV